MSYALCNKTIIETDKGGYWMVLYVEYIDDMSISYVMNVILMSGLRLLFILNGRNSSVYFIIEFIA